MSALEAAEAYVASLDSGPTLLMLAALRERFLAVADERDNALATLDAKKKQYSASLSNIKLVSARMIQEREAYILTLAKGGGNENA